MRNSAMLVLVSVVCIILSCSKDSELMNDNHEIKIRSSVSIPDDPATSFDEIMLGEEIEHPFSISNLNTALSLLCKDTSRVFTVTDRLIKFTFTDFENYRDIIIDTNYILFPYALNRKVLNMGEIYIGNRNSDLPCDMYGVIDVQTAIPTHFEHSVIEEYDFSVKDIFLLQKSFELTGNMDFLGIVDSKIS